MKIGGYKCISAPNEVGEEVWSLAASSRALTRRCVVASAERKSRVCRRVDDLLLEMFPWWVDWVEAIPKVGSPTGNKVAEKSRWKIFPIAEVV